MIYVRSPTQCWSLVVRPQGQGDGRLHWVVQARVVNRPYRGSSTKRVADQLLFQNKWVITKMEVNDHPSNSIKQFENSKTF